MEFKERLKQARKHARLTQTELGTAVGIDQTSISDLERGKSQSTSFIAEIAKACGVDALWLATGQGAMHSYSVGSKHAGDQLELAERAAPYAPKPESNAVMIGMMSAWDSDTPLHDDEVAIPFYKEVEMAAGCGATEVVEVPGRLLRFAKSTLRDAGVAEANAACVQIRGNSMERLIMDGATVGIDRGTTQIIDGEIYAIDHDGMLRIKYLYRMPGGGLRIRSENSEEHPDEILSAEDAARIRVLGWVFWWSTVRRRRGIQR